MRDAKKNPTEYIAMGFDIASMGGGKKTAWLSPLLGAVGSTIRYAGDILDYMEIANLLVSHGKNFFLNSSEKSSIQAFIDSGTWFDKYDRGIEVKDITLEEVKGFQSAWFSYVNQETEEETFETDILSLIAADEEDYKSLRESAVASFRDRLDGESVGTKEIGDVGENLIYGHECMRVKIGGREDLIKLIKCIPNHFAVGYDINSRELNETHRFVEVKTTISSRELDFLKFHLTPNEWKAAESSGQRYFVYRLLLSKRSIKLYILPNPVGQYKNNNLEMIPRDGADINFDPGKCGEFTKLLLWKD